MPLFALDYTAPLTLKNLKAMSKDCHRFSAASSTLDAACTGISVLSGSAVVAAAIGNLPGWVSVASGITVVLAEFLRKAYLPWERALIYEEAKLKLNPIISEYQRKIMEPTLGDEPQKTRQLPEEKRDELLRELSAVIEPVKSEIQSRRAALKRSRFPTPAPANTGTTPVAQ